MPASLWALTLQLEGERIQELGIADYPKKHTARDCASVHSKAAL